MTICQGPTGPSCVAPEIITALAKKIKGGGINDMVRTVWYKVLSTDIIDDTGHVR